MRCECAPCEFDFDICPISADPQRDFNVTVYDNLGGPMGRIAGGLTPNGSGGMSEMCPQANNC